MTVELGGAGLRLFWHPDVIALCLGLLVGHWALVRRFGPVLYPRTDQRAVTRGQRTAWVAGVVALFVAAGPPLHDAADQLLFSAHMIEHLLYALVVPPLLLVGTPQWMARLVLRDERVRRAVRAVCQPVVAGLVFNLMLVGLHWPPVIELMLANEVFHLASHAALLTVSIAMWANVASPAPDLVPRLPPLGQMLYLFLMTLLPTVPASFLTFGTTPLYGSYTGIDMPWGLTAVADMRIAGLIMKIGAGLLLWGVIAVLYFRWAGEQDPTPSAPGRGGGDDRGGHPGAGPARSRARTEGQL